VLSLKSISKTFKKGGKGMKSEKMKKAIAIISNCDSLSITEDDKKFIISVYDAILKTLGEVDLVTTELSAQFAVLKIATWNNGYFCSVARKIGTIIQPILRVYEEYP
jgi:hypothetical protein